MENNLLEDKRCKNPRKFQKPFTVKVDHFT